MKFDPTCNDIVAADADRTSITINPQKMENDYYAVNGEFFYKLMDRVQKRIHYTFHKSHRYTWLMKSIADYARHAYGPEDDPWSLPRPKRGDKYTDGYGVVARFLVWLEKKKSPRIVDDLNDRLQRGTFTMDDFRHLTGQSVYELLGRVRELPRIGETG